MKLVLILLFIGFTLADKFPNSYFAPPSNALSAAGTGFYVEVPQTTPKYKQPEQIFNNQRKPSNVVLIGYKRPNHFTNQPFYNSQSQDQQRFINQPQAQFIPEQNNFLDKSNNLQDNADNASPTLKFKNINNGDGSYQFEYETIDGISRHEEGHTRNIGSDQQENIVKGSYSYTGPEGKVYTITYWADSTGFHAIGDHLPTPPPIPEVLQNSLDDSRSQSNYDHQQYQRKVYSSEYHQ